MAKIIDPPGMNSLFSEIYQEVVQFDTHGKSAIPKRRGGILRRDVPILKYWLNVSYCTRNPSVVLDPKVLRDYMPRV